MDYCWIFWGRGGEREGAKIDIAMQRNSYIAKNKIIPHHKSPKPNPMIHILQSPNKSRSTKYMGV